MTAPLLTVDHLSFGFRDRPLYEDLSFTLPRGSMTSLIGANGVGKTTLVRLLMGELQPNAGTITFTADMKLGYVPQFRNIDSEFPLTIASFVQLNQLGHGFPWHTKREKVALHQALAQTHLLERRNLAMGRASGGEKQKAYLAQALLTQPNFLILDEATASLDVNTKEELMGLVKELNETLGLTVLFVTHDLGLAKAYTDQYLLLTPGHYEMRATDQMDIATMPDELKSGEEEEAAH
ncbi:metal ABC transporter ATP-binding protein [Lacticaseibacillus yichunensis]|uniref:Metal ABC transporter ATP-binding protein n=1 Tax=Lacticaseibacillus yichunensis TaxID=2486015 RepID=A0ABW4CNF4_9LACO|nr:ATP-binding cassette domain-containing protein [Lacticaseibacillus yichunensis]